MKNETKGQIREADFGSAIADLFRELETGHPPDQEVATFVRISAKNQIQYGIVVNVGSKVPPLSEISRGVDIEAGESAEDRMYVDVHNPMADYSAHVIIVAKQENGKIVPGPKLSVTLPYSRIIPVSDSELDELLGLGYFFLYPLIDEVEERLLLTLISILPERLKESKNFSMEKYLVSVVDILSSIKGLDISRADVRERLSRLAPDAVGAVYVQERMTTKILVFPGKELKAGDVVAIRDCLADVISVAIVMNASEGVAEAQLELQRRMSSENFELASRPVHKGSTVDIAVEDELIQLSRPRGPPNAIRIPLGNIYGTSLVYELELMPGENPHCGLTAMSGGGKSVTVKGIAYHIIRHKLRLGMLIFDEHGEYYRSGEDYGLDKFDRKAFIYADPIADPTCRIPLHWIPLDRFLEGTTSIPARHALRVILQYYYNGPGRNDSDKPQRTDRLSVSALNWIISQGEARQLKNAVEGGLLKRFQDNTLNIIIGELRLLYNKADLIQIEYDEEQNNYRDIYPKKDGESYDEWESRRDHLLKKVFVAQKQVKVMVLDVSAITSTDIKMWIKRLVLDTVVNQRKNEYRENKEKFERETPLFMFIFEEATAAFDEETLARMREFRDFAVQARKFYCGYMPVMADPSTVDPTLLSQLQNNILLKIPQKDLRQQMFRKLPCDATPFDSFIETASPGQGIVVNPVKRGLGNLPIPVKVTYFNDLIEKDLQEARKELKDDIDKIVELTKLSKEFVASRIKVGGDDYADRY